MKKIGPILVIISSISTLAFAILGLLLIYKQITLPSWVWKTNQIKIGSKISYFIQMGLGLAQIFLAISALKKPRGFSSFIIMIILGIQISGYIYLGINHNWKISAIIPLVIVGLAELGMVSGFLKGNK